MICKPTTRRAALGNCSCPLPLLVGPPSNIYKAFLICLLYIYSCKAGLVESQFLWHILEKQKYIKFASDDRDSEITDSDG